MVVRLKTTATTTEILIYCYDDVFASHLFSEKECNNLY